METSALWTIFKDCMSFKNMYWEKLNRIISVAVFVNLIFLSKHLAYYIGLRIQLGLCLILNGYFVVLVLYQIKLSKGQIHILKLKKIQWTVHIYRERYIYTGYLYKIFWKISRPSEERNDQRPIQSVYISFHILSAHSSVNSAHHFSSLIGSVSLFNSKSTRGLFNDKDILVKRKKEKQNKNSVVLFKPQMGRCEVSTFTKNERNGATGVQIHFQATIQ